MSFCCEICWEEFLLNIQDSPLFAHVTEELSGDIHTQSFWRKFLDGSSLRDAHQSFYDNLLDPCAKNEHKECMMEAINSISAFHDQIKLRVNHINFILSDIDLVHTAQQKLRFISGRYSWRYNEGIDLGKISIDVYRYMMNNGGNESDLSGHVTWQSMWSGNSEVVKYLIATDEIKKLNLPEKTLGQFAAGACLSENGAACVAAFCEAGLCSRDTLQKSINEWIQTTKEDDDDDDDELPELRKNLAELIEKNYICGSEVCYKI